MCIEEKSTKIWVDKFCLFSDVAEVVAWTAMIYDLCSSSRRPQTADPSLLHWKLTCLPSVCAQAMATTFENKISITPTNYVLFLILFFMSPENIRYHNCTTVRRVLFIRLREWQYKRFLIITFLELLHNALLNNWPNNPETHRCAALLCLLTGYLFFWHSLVVCSAFTIRCSRLVQSLKSLLVRK